MSNSRDRILKISNLIVTQNDLRNWNRCQELADEVKSGKIWSDGFTRINILQAEDGSKYVMDGHHRVTACVLGGREKLYSTEYQMSYVSYDMFNSINWLKGWVTPFDPRDEVRLADFQTFKKEILTSEKSRDLLEKEIWANYNLYKTARGNLVSFYDLTNLHKFVI